MFGGLQILPRVCPHQVGCPRGAIVWVEYCGMKLKLVSRARNGMLDRFPCVDRPVKIDENDLEGFMVSI